MGFVYVLVFVVLLGMSVWKGVELFVNWLSECVLGLFDWLEELYEKIGVVIEREKEFGRKVRELRKGGMVLVSEEVWNEMMYGEKEEWVCESCGDSVLVEGEMCSDCKREKMESWVEYSERRVELDEEKVGGWDLCLWCGEKKEVCDCMWEGKGE